MASLNQDDFSSLASDVYVARVAIVATLAILVYDYLLTFSAEKDLVWPSQFSVVKVAFLLNRYVPFVGTVGNLYVFLLIGAADYPQKCGLVFRALGGANWLEYMVAEFILYARAYAVWGCKRSTLFLLGIIYLSYGIVAAYFSFRFLESADAVVDLHLFPTGCIINVQGHIGRLSMIILAISETFALLALVAKAIQMPTSMMMKRIIADGVIYFVVILCATIANIVFLTLAPPAICNLLLIPQVVLHSICCNCLLFRIRSNHDCAHSTVQLESVHFAQVASTTNST